LYGFIKNDPVDNIDMLGANVIEKIKLVGELPWTEYQNTAITYGENPDETLGMNATYFDAEWECRACGNDSGCESIYVSQDTTLGGVVFWLNTPSKTRSGRTIGEHERTHLTNIRGGAKDFDKKLHNIANGVCVTHKCCFAKKQYLYKALSYIRALVAYDDAFLEAEDYFGTYSIDASLEFDRKRAKLESALILMGEAESEMSNKCEKR